MVPASERATSARRRTFITAEATNSLGSASQGNEGATWLGKPQHPGLEGPGCLVGLHRIELWTSSLSERKNGVALCCLVLSHTV